jgi:predicted DNA binding CopG/RHH family protein
LSSGRKSYNPPPTKSTRLLPFSVTPLIVRRFIGILYLKTSLCCNYFHRNCIKILSDLDVPIEAGSVEAVKWRLEDDVGAAWYVPLLLCPHTYQTKKTQGRLLQKCWFLNEDVREIIPEPAFLDEVIEKATLYMSSLMDDGDIISTRRKAEYLYYAALFHPEHINRLKYFRLYIELKREYSTYAKETLKKDRRINIRISDKNLESIQNIAIEEGIPYQTLISSLIHKFVTGKITERNKIL